MHKTLAVFLITLMGVVHLSAQILVEYNKTPEQLVNELLLGKKSGIKVSKVKYQGNPYALGAYHTFSEYMPVKKGIILSTGRADQADGPNESTNTGVAFYTPGYDELSQIAKGVTGDAAVLSFTFYPTTDSVEFEYSFASEEYPEFVNKGVNDVFAFFISGEGYDKPFNMALIPRTQTPVTVDNINDHTNTKYYLEARQWQSANMAFFKQHLDIGDRAYNCEYDGMTVCLKAKAKVKPFYPYLLTMAIADVGDFVYDSGVFLKMGSLKSKGQPVNILDQLAERLKGEKDIEVKVDSNSIGIFADIHFEFDSDVIKSDYLSELDKLKTILESYFTLHIQINGYADQQGSESYNFKLSERRAKAVYDQLINMGIEPARLSYKGMGELDKHSTSDMNLSRKVEILLWE